MGTEQSNTALFTEKLKANDEEALSLLVDMYHHKLCLYAFHLTNDHAESKDIVQNVFFRLWKYRHRLGNVTNIKSFLFSAVYNGFLNSVRDSKNLLDIEKIQIAEVDTIVHSELDHVLKQQIEIVKRGIENLPPKCKRVFKLSKMEGLTNMEIAEYMGISKKTVENHISKAFRILRVTLERQYNDVLLAD